MTTMQEIRKAILSSSWPVSAPTSADWVHVESIIPKLDAAQELVTKLELDIAALRAELAILMNVINELPDEALDKVPTHKLHKAFLAMSEADKHEHTRTQIDKVVADNDRLRAQADRINDWTHECGAALCPRAGMADTFGDGMRTAKAEVSSMLWFRNPRGPQADSDARTLLSVLGEIASMTAEFLKWQEAEASEIPDQADEVEADHNTMLQRLISVHKIASGQASKR